MDNFINIDATNIDSEHICCAFSDKKCSTGYQLKKEWLKAEFENGYVFRRLNERAKVFIEYGPAENGWVPITAPNYLLINCFWVSGQYKGKGYATKLLQSAIDDARKTGKSGLVTVVGTKKFHFMSDTKWFLKHGFTAVEQIVSGFSLLVYKLDPKADDPRFNESVLSGQCMQKEGVTVYYSNRCPFTEFHIQNSLIESVTKRNIPLTVVKLDTAEQAQNAPSPATIFSMFYNGQFVTTDLSVCMDSRFDKAIKR